MLNTIERNGVFTKYCKNLKNREEAQETLLRRAAREKKREEIGDGYISSESEKKSESEESEEDFGETSSD